MNVFDFDDTVYNGECSLDFFKFCIKKKPLLMRHMPKVMAMVTRYKMGKVAKSEMMKFAGYILDLLAENMKDLDKMIEAFWKENMYKLKPSMIGMLNSESVIISASPSFLLNGIRSKVNGANIISTEIDLSNMKIKTLCYGENKVVEFKKHYPDIIPQNFYTDNMNDKPMINFSENAWLVRDNTIVPIKK